MENVLGLFFHTEKSLRIKPNFTVCRYCCIIKNFIKGFNLTSFSKYSMLRAPIAGMSFTPGEIRLNLWGSLDE